MKAATQGRKALKWAVLLTTPLMLAALLAMIFSSSFGRSRSFILDATATGAQIRFEGSGNAWPLGEGRVCAPRPRPDLRAARGEGFCDGRLFAEKALEGAAVIWPEGAQARLALDAQGALIVTAKGAQGLPDGARIRLAPEEWRKAGALVFTGHAVLGGQMASGETALLLGGRYEARESAMFGLGGATETVKSGELRRGERASLVTREGPASGFGHVTAGGEDDEGFHIVSVAKPGDTILQIEYLGGERPNFVKPNWIDYALSSPFFVALALILSLVIGVGQLVLGLWEIFAREQEEPKPEAPPALAPPPISPAPADSPSDPEPQA